MENISEFLQPTTDPTRQRMRKDLLSGFKCAENPTDTEVRNFYDGFHMMNAIMKESMQPGLRTPSDYYIAWQESLDERYPYEIAMIVLVNPKSNLATHVGITKSHAWIQEEIRRKQKQDQPANNSHHEKPALPVSMIFHREVAQRILALYPNIAHMVTIPSLFMLDILYKHLPSAEVGYIGEEDCAKEIFDKIREFYERLFSQKYFTAGMNAQREKYAGKPEVLKRIKATDQLKRSMETLDLQKLMADFGNPANMNTLIMLVQEWSENIGAFADKNIQNFIESSARALLGYFSLKYYGYDTKFPQPKTLTCYYKVDTGRLASMHIGPDKVDLDVSWWFGKPLFIPQGLGALKFFLTKYDALAQLEPAHK